MIRYLFILFSTAIFAQNKQPANGSFLEMLPMLLIFIGLFYFMIIRPQTKQKNDHEHMIKNLQSGDEISTSGGIIGKIVSIDGNIIKLAIAKETIISIHENNINKILPKGSFK